jgi:hypothetical protein
MHESITVAQESFGSHLSHADEFRWPPGFLYCHHRLSREVIGGFYGVDKLGEPALASLI